MNTFLARKLAEPSIESLRHFLTLCDDGLSREHACEGAGLPYKNVKQILAACLRHGLIYESCLCGGRATASRQGYFMCARCEELDFGSLRERRIADARLNSSQPKPTPVPAITGYTVHLVEDKL